KALQLQIGFHTARTKKLEERRDALTALVRDGGEFEADAAVSEEHIYKMQVLANLLKKASVAEDRLPKEARATELEQTAARQLKSASAVRAATEKAKGELVLLDKHLAEAGAAAAAAVTQFANLKE